MKIWPKSQLESVTRIGELSAPDPSQCKRLLCWLWRPGHRSSSPSTSEQIGCHCQNLHWTWKTWAGSLNAPGCSIASKVQITRVCVCLCVCVWCVCGCACVVCVCGVWSVVCGVWCVCVWCVCVCGVCVWCVWCVWCVCVCLCVCVV